MVALRIVLVGPVYPYRGGIAHHTTRLAQALLAAQHQVQVVSFKRQYPQWLYPGSSDKDPSQQPLQVPAVYWLDSLNPWSWWQTAQRIKQLKPDCVVIAWWTTFWALADWVLVSELRRAGVKVVFLIHNVFPHEARQWDYAVATQVLKHGSAFVAQTKREAERLRAIVPQAVVEICDHPVYDMFANQTLSQAEAQHQLAIPEGHKVALMFGLIRPYKGLRYLLEALAQLPPMPPPWYLIVAGEFWEDVQIYQTYCQQVGLAARVRFESRYIPNEEVGAFFAAADVFVAPYIEGTQSGAVNLALGFGVPVIATPFVGVEDAPGLIRVPASDAPALADALQRVARQPHQRVPQWGNWSQWVQTLEALMTAS